MKLPCFLPGIALFLLFACKNKDVAEEVEVFKPNTGQIQILNGSGIPGVAEKMRNYLSDFGFDVVEFGNAQSWNYPETIVISRTKKNQIAMDLARILDTDNWFQLIDEAPMVSVTVIVGKDYYRRIYDKKRTEETPTH